MVYWNTVKGMQRAGFIQWSGQTVIDNDGVPREVLEVVIHRENYAIQVSDLVKTIQGNVPARVEWIAQNWTRYLGGVSGTARLSESGMALMIDLSGGTRFCAPLVAVLDVLERKTRYARVSALPSRPSLISCSIPGVHATGQTVLPGFA
jgi:hypothetical protein